jgi:hypothetical protein
LERPSSVLPADHDEAYPTFSTNFIGSTGCWLGPDSSRPPDSLQDKVGPSDPGTLVKVMPMFQFPQAKSNNLVIIRAQVHKDFHLAKSFHNNILSSNISHFAADPYFPMGLRLLHLL